MLSIVVAPSLAEEQIMDQMINITNITNITIPATFDGDSHCWVLYVTALQIKLTSIIMMQLSRCTVILQVVHKKHRSRIA
jgi:hypothetical protein